MSGRGKKKAAATSKTLKAGLVFPVPRMIRLFRQQRTSSRISVGAGVYMAAVMEYLAAEVLELSGNCARDSKKKRIIPRHIMLALAADEEFNDLMAKNKVSIAEAGVPPHIRSELLRGHKAKKATAEDDDDDSSKAPANASSVAPPKKKKAPKHGKTVTSPPADSSSSTAPSAAPSKDKKVQRSGTYEQLGKKQLHLGQNLVITKSNLGKYDKCEALVHPTNANLSTSGMVGNELIKYGGEGLRNAIASESGSLGVTQCCITEAGDLSADWVIHCNSPSWNAGNPSQSMTELGATINNILRLADTKSLKSVALPSIGSGNNGFPKDDAARTILHAIDNYFMSIMSSSLKAVHFVLYDDESLDVYNKVYAHEFP